MAEEKEQKEDELELGDTQAAPRPKLSIRELAVILNSVFILAALGVLVYTKMVYKRPVISESSEIQAKQEELKKPAAIADRTVVTFDQLRVNIAMTSGKAHYATIAYAAECKNPAIAETVRKKRDIFVDKIIRALGRRQMTELNTVQGKLVLKSELLREFNEIVEPAAITDLYFSTFILQ